MTASDQLEYLENFILRNPELEKLESLLQEFNIFETLGLTHSEIRHSNLISWLLNPLENHGLHSYFLKQFFKFIVSSNRAFFEQQPISVFDFELFTYAKVEIRKEWNRIDILVIIIENDKKVVVAIENKVKTVEHSDQLNRYHKIVEAEFKDFVRLYVYLTPDRLPPSSQAWIEFGYSTIADIIKYILDYKKTSLSPGVTSFLSQYHTILRRYIVGESEVENIAVEIYKKHQAALDIIFQYKPDIYLELSNALQEKLSLIDLAIIDTGAKTTVRFTTKTIDSLVESVGEGWTKSKRILLFEFSLSNSRVVLNLYIGPGEASYREHLRKLFLKDKSLFKFIDRNFGTKWHCVYQKIFLTKKVFEGNDSSELKEILSNKLEDFFENDIRLIHEHLVKYHSAVVSG